MAYSLPIPFFPQTALKRGIGDSMVGLIFGIFPVGSISISILFGKMMGRWGKQRLIVISIVILSLSNMMFGALDYIDDPVLFVTTAMITRVVQGLGVGGFSSIANAYMPVLYPDSVLQKISFMELSLILGVAAGPLLGGILYEIGGYEVPFFSAAIFYMIIAIPILRILPEDHSFKNGAPLSLRKVLFTRRYFLTLILVFNIGAGLTFIEPTIANHLSNEFGLSPGGVGAIYSIYSLFDIIICLFNIFVPRFQNSVQFKNWLLIGNLIHAVGLLLVGPEQLLGLPMSLWVISVALALLGVATGYALPPAIPELIRLSEKIYPGEQERLSDMSAGFFAASIQSGQLMGPIVGGILVQNMGFPRSATLLSCFQFITIFCYLFGGYVESYSFLPCFRKKQKGQPLLDDADMYRAPKGTDLEFSKGK